MEKRKVGESTPNRGNAGKGRAVGVPNKATKAFRDTVNKLLEDNADNVGTWLTQVAADNPKEALDIIAKLAEYASPKLARVEQQTEIKMAPSFNLIVSGNG